MLNFISQLIEPIIPTLQGLSTYLFKDILTFLITMAVVYIVGRMLMLTKSDRVKNSIALLVIIGLNYFTFRDCKLLEMIFNIALHSSICVLLYVLIGFNLFDRVDNFLDRHFGKDKGIKKK